MTIGDEAIEAARRAEAIWVRAHRNARRTATLDTDRVRAIVETAVAWPNPRPSPRPTPHYSDTY